ncbi:MAG: ABC transporter permease [Clostridiales bacterium]|nr:ABC transporter permease [Clostridiales bacterium]
MDVARISAVFRLLLFYFILAFAFWAIGDIQIRTREMYADMPAADSVVGEITAGTVIEQTFVSGYDSIEKFTLCVATYARSNRGILTVALLENQTQEQLAELRMDASLLEDNSYYEWPLETPLVSAKGRSYTIRVTSDCLPGEAPTIYCSNEPSEDTRLLINGADGGQMLCFSFCGRSVTWFGAHYWLLAGAGAVVLTLYGLWVALCERQGKATLAGTYAALWKRYRFLVQQLVSRDFKKKYKRSLLGYLWSFLNPLLTMLVQYIVFSTIFRSDIKNFPVYLLSGIILFNFFTDAVSQGLSAIIGNASLITKVYVPKYIYPVTRVISSSINLLISILPLLLVALLTRAPVTKALLLLPFALICLIGFSIGMALMLSSAMVFFRDTQYLWGIFSLIWMYATPLFYPETIIPPQYRWIQVWNPMYYMVKFVRILLIDGVSPSPRLYGICIISALASLIVGGFVFKKTQDRFVLYI